MIIFPLLFAAMSSWASTASTSIMEIKREAAYTRLAAIDAVVRPATSLDESIHQLYRARGKAHGQLEFMLATWPEHQGNKEAFRRILKSTETAHFAGPNEDRMLSLQNHHVRTLIRLIDDLAGFLKIQSSWRYTDDGRLIRDLRDDLVAGAGGHVASLDGLLPRIENAASRTTEVRAAYLRGIGEMLASVRHLGAVERRNSFASALKLYFDLEAVIHGIDDAVCASKLSEPPKPPVG